MARTLTRNFITLVLLILPLSLWADSNLDYQNRGDRFEGIRSKPVSGYDIELISVLVDYQEPAAQLPGQRRAGFVDGMRSEVDLGVVWQALDSRRERK